MSGELAIVAEGLGDERYEHGVAKRHGLGLDRDQREMLDGAGAGRDAAAVADEPDRLVAQREADEDVVDRVLQLTGDLWLYSDVTIRNASPSASLLFHALTIGSE